MKRIMILLLFLFATFCAKAQAPQNAQKQIEDAKKMLKQMQSDPKIQAAMKRAQQAMNKAKSNTQLQNQMAQRSLRLDSLKKTDPAYANMKTPDNDNMQIIGFDSIGSMLNAASEQAQNYSQTTNQTVPKQDISHHAEKLAKLTSISLSSSVNNILKKLKEQFDIVTLSNLNAMVKDTGINIASLGAFMLTTGADQNATLYLICNGILKKPQNPWAVNDLGVYYRDAMDNTKALECFFYSNKLDSGKNTAINTNIGWAAAYYGDFDASKKYFDKALAIDSNFTSANEGEAMLAYARGDFGALWKILAKEVKNISYNSSAFDDGLSDDFATTCANAAAETEGNLDNQTTDPNDDHTFDNPNPDDGLSQDQLPSGDVDDIQYTRYKKVFVSDPRQIFNSIREGALQSQKTYAEMKIYNNALAQELKSLKPLMQAPYKDDKGNLLFPNSFGKYVALLTSVEISFEKRTEWYINKLKKKLESLRKDVINRDMDMQKQYSTALLACGKLNGDSKDACVQEVECQWIPKMYTSKNNDLNEVANLWNDYYDHTVKSIQWYIDASAPFISRVHEAGWNQYLNAKRELAVRVAIIKAYGWWLDAVGDIATPIVDIIQQKAPACPVFIPPSENPPDPFSKKPKRLKEFEGPCFHLAMTILIAGFETDCHGDQFNIGLPPGKTNPLPFSLGASYSQTTDPTKAQNEGYSHQIGVSLGVGKSVGIISAGVQAGGNLQFNDNWQLTGGSISEGLKAGVGNETFSIGPKATFQIVAGQLQANSFSSLSTTVPLH